MTSAILKTIPVMQSLALAGAAYGTVKKKKKKRFVKSAVDIIVGTEIIKATSKSI